MATPAEQATEAKLHWKAAKKTKHFGEVRERLADMAKGRARCMYCEDSQGTDIDHFEPIDRAPQKAYEWENYFLACSYCNSNLKREKFPVNKNDDPLLIDPCADEPSHHLDLMIHSCLFGALTEKGLHTINVFGLNDRQPLVDGRTAALVVTLKLIPVYAKLRSDNTYASNRSADVIFETLGAASFSVVIVTLISMFKCGSPMLTDELANAFYSHPELLNLA